MVQTYQERVFNLVVRMLNSREEAEDVAQEVFVTVFKAIEGFRGDSQLSTWIYRIAVNHCKNRLKYLARRQTHLTESFDEIPNRAGRGTVGVLAAATGLAAPARAPDKVLEGRRMELALQQAIAALDAEQRVLVVLRDLQGLSYQEIVTITGLAEGTVKSRLHRARVVLKDALKEHL